ncbi:MAG TPA: lytic transglycosylase domain-containing protein [Ruminiclostridium sp.]|nr:lytic transglycosylase domain-containing protein [Ruminiclostridium sp.]
MILLRKKKKSGFKIFGVLLTLAILAVLGILASRYVLESLYPLKYTGYVEKYSREYNLDKHMVYAVIKAESSFNSQAVSPRDAKGLMQIMDSTGDWAAKKMNIKHFDPSMLLEPETNIRIGCWYLSYLLKQFHNNTVLALAAYNAGSGNVSKWLKDPEISADGKNLSIIPFQETENYVGRIQKYYKMYKKLYAGNE